MLAASREVLGPLTCVASLQLTSQGAEVDIFEKYTLCCKRQGKKKHRRTTKHLPSLDLILQLANPQIPPPLPFWAVEQAMLWASVHSSAPAKANACAAVAAQQPAALCVEVSVTDVHSLASWELYMLSRVSGSATLIPLPLFCVEVPHWDGFSPFWGLSCSLQKYI